MKFCSFCLAVVRDLGLLDERVSQILSVCKDVNKKRVNLKDSDKTKLAFLNEDLPLKINQQCADLRCIVNHAKSKNVNAKIIGNRISVDNRVYSYKDIDRLPEGLKISDAKLVDTPKGLAFQSHYAFLSNFFPTR